MAFAALTPAGELLREEIRRTGPIPFSRFMEVALYDPLHGYYRRRQQSTGGDPFGRSGDFFTAAQLQPVFGRLMAAVIADLKAGLPAEEHFRVIDLGAGRGEMAEAFAEFDYVAVDAGDTLPTDLVGVIFANEFFDALPVDVSERMVDFDGTRFVWTGKELGAWTEIPVGLRREVPRIAAALKCGYLLAIDYGFTEREAVRFPGGTLMSYRRHVALDDVLASPGEQDITAHVPFDELFRCAQEHGFQLERFETLAQLLLRAGEPDSFEAALQADDDKQAQHLRMQLKTLLFGMGETFRCALLRKVG